MNGPPLPRIAQVPYGMDPMTPLWRLTTVCSALGVSHRQADHWIRSGALAISFAADGSGSVRLLTVEDLVTLARVARLRWHGIHLHLIGDNLYDQLLPDGWEDTTLDALPGPDTYAGALVAGSHEAAA